jgi:hypothetical protein
VRLKRSLVALAVLGLTAAAATNALADDEVGYDADVIYGDGFDADACPAGRQTVADIGYTYGLGSTTIARGVDVTQADNIWGRTSPTQTIVGFPWDNYFAIIMNFNKTSYIAARFVVPDDADPLLTGLFSHGETLPGPNLTMSISTTCADFHPADAICLRTNINAGGLLTKFMLPGATDPRTGLPVIACPLEPGQTYFVNIKMTNPPVTHQDCNSTTCKVTVQTNH